MIITAKFSCDGHFYHLTLPINLRRFNQKFQRECHADSKNISVVVTFKQHLPLSLTLSEANRLARSINRFEIRNQTSITIKQLSNMFTIFQLQTSTDYRVRQLISALKTPNYLLQAGQAFVGKKLSDNIQHGIFVDINQSPRTSY